MLLMLWFKPHGILSKWAFHVLHMPMGAVSLWCIFVNLRICLLFRFTDDSTLRKSMNILLKFFLLKIIIFVLWIKKPSVTTGSIITLYAVPYRCFVFHFSPHTSVFYIIKPILISGEYNMNTEPWARLSFDSQDRIFWKVCFPWRPVQNYPSIFLKEHHSQTWWWKCGGWLLCSFKTWKTFHNKWKLELCLMGKKWK